MVAIGTPWFASAPPQSLIHFVNGNTLSMSTELLIWVAVAAYGRFTAYYMFP